MPLDIEKYRHYVAGYDLSEQEKMELIQTVWAIMESFVDQAFGQHPHQQCGTRLEFSDLQEDGESLESNASNLLQKSRPVRYETLKHVGPP